MKHKLLALILALTLVSWAQTATPTAPADQPKSTEQEKCACCDKMASADAKGAKMCARHSKDAKHGAGCCDGKEGMSCCGKDGHSCMKDKQAAAACCKNCGKEKTASCCGGECKEGCCSKTTAAMNCCHHQTLS